MVVRLWMTKTTCWVQCLSEMFRLRILFATCIRQWWQAARCCSFRFMCHISSKTKHGWCQYVQLKWAKQQTRTECTSRAALKGTWTLTFLTKRLQWRQNKLRKGNAKQHPKQDLSWLPSNCWQGLESLVWWMPTRHTYYWQMHWIPLALYDDHTTYCWAIACWWNVPLSLVKCRVQS